MKCFVLEDLIYLKNKHLAPQHSNCVKVPIADIGGCSTRPLCWTRSVGPSSGSCRWDPGSGRSWSGFWGDAVSNSRDDVWVQVIWWSRDGQGRVMHWMSFKTLYIHIHTHIHLHSYSRTHIHIHLHSYSYSHSHSRTFTAHLTSFVPNINSDRPDGTRPKKLYAIIEEEMHHKFHEFHPDHPHGEKTHLSSSTDRKEPWWLRGY